MNKILLFSIVIYIGFAAALDGGKKLRLKFCTSEIKIDGIIDEVWSKADSADSFFQLSPYYAKSPTYTTSTKVLTTEDALYVLIKCEQPADKLQAQAGKLDDETGDAVSFMIDTFGDRRTAYRFAVSASGVMWDARMLDDGRNYDIKWDGIWFGDAHIYDWGYVVEMKIPYTSIQYDESLDAWGLDMDRWVAHLYEDLYWNRYEQNEGLRVSKFGNLQFENFHPTAKGSNLEIYPVALSEAIYQQNNEYKLDVDAGLDIFYNPSSQLTYQLTVNPDFAQIEADPFDFNISRYESYFDERRPFFTEGNEVFMPSGRESSSGFYRPLELFYSRRIGKKLPDGNEVPLIFGTKAFGRINEWEYGGFLAMTGETDYQEDSLELTEPLAYFGSARIKKQIMDNSSIGALFVGKKTKDDVYGVVDIDGAFRGGSWQLAYQLAGSFTNSEGGFAASAGYRYFGPSWANFARLRHIGNTFDVSQVGFVPWIGTTEFVGLTGPRWYFDKGAIAAIIIYTGPLLYYENADKYTDYGAIGGMNMRFRDNWGYELNFSLSKARDEGVTYTSYEFSLSSWMNISTLWSANFFGGYSRTYNFSRDYLASYSWAGGEFAWKALRSLELGTSLDAFIEGNPEGNIEDVTYNARPYFSFTPVNNLNIRFYVDNVFLRSTDQLEHMIGGLLFSYNFSPKSWIYFAINEVRQRNETLDEFNRVMSRKMEVTDRAAVIKIKYLFYF